MQIANCAAPDTRGDLRRWMRLPIWYRGFAVAGGLFMTALLLVPNPHAILPIPVPVQNFLGNGYTVHFSLYAALTVLALSIGDDRRRTLQWYIGVIGTHALLTETAQLAIPGRTWDPLDLACNLAGITFTIVLCQVCQLWRGRFRKAAF